MPLYGYYIGIMIYKSHIEPDALEKIQKRKKSDLGKNKPPASCEPASGRDDRILFCFVFYSVEFLYNKFRYKSVA